MNLLLLSGIGCDERIWRDTDLTAHSVTHIDYTAVMDEKPDTMEALAKNIGESLETCRFDGVIAHSMGGLLAAVMLDRGWIETRFLIAIETAFVPQDESYRTLFHPDTEASLQEELMGMLKHELPKYPDALKKTLKGDFDFEVALLSITIPTTLVYGRRQMKGESELKENLNLSKETLDKVSLRFIDKAAHFPMMEDPVRINEVLDDVNEL